MSLYFSEMSATPTAASGCSLMNATLSVPAFLWLVASGICSLHAQVLPFDHYTEANGLLSNSTTVLFQSSQGYLFIGTAEGLSAFDGYSFTHSRTKDGLPSNFINGITELPSYPGVLWLGTNNGLARLDARGIRQILLDTTDLSRLVRSVEEDATQQLWCATRGGLYTIRNETITRVPVLPEGEHPHSVLKPGIDSLIWVPSGNRLFAFSPSGFLVHRIQLSAQSTKQVTEAYRDRSGRIWIGLQDSTLSLYRDAALIHRRRIPSGRVLHLMEDKTGVLYIGTENGLLFIHTDMFATADFERIGPDNGLPGKSVTAGLVDSEGDLWLSCEGHGISRLKTQGHLEFMIDGIPHAYNNMRATCDSAGHYWVLSGSDLVELRPSASGGWSVSRHRLGESTDGTPQGVICDSKNRLWILFGDRTHQCYHIGHGVERRSELHLSHVHHTLPLGTRPRLFTVDKKNRFWWTDSLHLVVADNKRIKKYRLMDLLGETDVRTMLEDSRGNTWLGGFSKGIAVLHGDSLDAPPRLLVPHVDIPAGFIRAFCEDVFGRMWAGTRYGGCMILGDNNVQVLSAANVLPSDAVWTISRDSSGSMWLGTSQGLVAIDPSTLLPHPAGNDLVRKAVVSSGVSRKGMLWYVTPTGLGHIDRSRLHKSSPNLEVRLVRMDVHGSPVDVTRPLAFAHSQNSVVFTFLASTLRNARDVLYQYRLGDVDWEMPTPERSVAYASLRPGEYTFEVRATRVRGGEFGTPASVSFTIAPPYWETWWFRLVSLFAVGGLAFAFYRRRIRVLEREKQTQQEFSRRLLESQENERKRIAGELHDSLVQELLVAKNRSLMALKNVEDVQRVGRELEEISSAVGSAIDEVREIAHNLRPYQLDRMGFSKAVRSLMARLSESSTIRLDASIDDVDAEMNEATIIHLYRIIQEALNNILRHSGAACASVSLKLHDRSVELQIRDDGRGMPADKPTGFGLDGIAQRVSFIGGTHEIRSVAGGGTSLLIRIPKHTRTDGKEDHSSYSG